MSYNKELIRKGEFEVSNWSGGTTTQLAIFPKDAVYSERNFRWRLSSAKVELEESVFTQLPNINRIIMIMEGKLILEHEGHHKRILEPFEQDHFSGSWKTKSFGKVTDFNLMMDENCVGKLEAIQLEKLDSISIYQEDNCFFQNTEAIYCVNGQVKIEISKEDMIDLYESDILLVTSKENKRNLDFKIYNSIEEKTNLIRASIHY